MKKLLLLIPILATSCQVTFSRAPAEPDNGNKRFFDMMEKVILRYADEEEKNSLYLTD